MSQHRTGISRFATAMLLTATLILMGSPATSHAAPPGIPAGSKLEFNFNVIGFPAGKTYQGDCGDGHRIFVNRDAKGATMRVTDAASWSVIDCNATSDHTAVLGTNEALVFDVYVRILGKPDGTFHACANTLEDFTNGETLCLLGTIDLTRGKGQSKFSIAPASMFDASLQDLMWTLDTNSDFRIAQFRVYSRPQ